MSVYAKIPIVSDSVTREGVSLTVDHIMILESILFVTELLTYILITAPRNLIRGHMHTIVPVLDLQCYI